MASFREMFLAHHFSDATRSARRNLLLLSVVSYLLVKGQWVPDKIDFLGLSIGALQHTTLMQVLLALIGYYFVKFYLYMFTDGEIHIYKAYSSLLDEQKAKTWKEHRAAVRAKQREAFAQIGGWGMLLVSSRVALDTLLPVVVGGYAIILVSHAL
jgi:hypothetical protein